MLGWEYPPRFAGGLGKACKGLSQAMARKGAQVFFVLPTFSERVSERHLEVVGAWECLLEAGWRPDMEIREVRASGQLLVQRTPAHLYPYGAAPSGEISESLRSVLEGMSEGSISKISQLQPQTQLRLRIIPSEPEIYGKNLWYEIEKFCFTVRHLTETHEVDVVHAHDWMTFPAAFEFQRVAGVPVYLHVHATEYDRSGENLNHEVFRIERDGFRKADHIFTVSRYTAGILEKLYGVDGKKISVIYNAPEESRFEKQKEFHRLSQVVFLGRLTFQKGPDHFLKAAALVHQADPEARFIFCGTGDMLDKLRSMAYHLGIENCVHFAGFIEPAEVDEILLRSRVLVMPSVSEPFGLVALEAIRCGIPVILSKQSGVREVLPRALQVDFWDHMKLADQILAALRLRGLSQHLVEEGMNQVLQLSWDKSADRVMEVYRKNLGSTYAQAIGGGHGH